MEERNQLLILPASLAWKESLQSHYLADPQGGWLPEDQANKEAWIDEEESKMKKDRLDWCLRHQD